MLSDGPLPAHIRERQTVTGVFNYTLPTSTDEAIMAANAEIAGFMPLMAVSFEPPLETVKGLSAAGASLDKKSLAAFVKTNGRYPVVGEKLQGDFLPGNVLSYSAMPNSFSNFRIAG